MLKPFIMLGNLDLIDGLGKVIGKYILNAANKVFGNPKKFFE